MNKQNWFEPDNEQLGELYDVQTTSSGPPGELPFTDQMLRERPSGDLFGWSQDAAMGWNPTQLTRDEFLILSTMGGLRAPDGSPIALGSMKKNFIQHSLLRLQRELSGTDNGQLRKWPPVERLQIKSLLTRTIRLRLKQKYGSCGAGNLAAGNLAAGKSRNAI